MLRKIANERENERFTEKDRDIEKDDDEQVITSED